MYVGIDKETQNLFLNLPEEYRDYFADLYQSLDEEFAFESLNKNTLENMDKYIIEWFNKRGIKLKVDKTGDN